MAFTDAEKVDIRRYCGFQAYGGQSAQAFGQRFFTHYGALEFRMNNLLAEEEAVARGLLAQLAALGAAVPTAGGNLDTDAASVWTRNKNEVRDRMGLYRLWRLELCAFFGVPAGPGLEGSGGLELVV